MKKHIITEEEYRVVKELAKENKHKRVDKRLQVILLRFEGLTDIKIGISGQPLNKNGTSPRANSQVNNWNKAAGYDKYAANVVKTNMPGREIALNWEETMLNVYGMQATL